MKENVSGCFFLNTVYYRPRPVRPSVCLSDSHTGGSDKKAAADAKIAPIRRVSFHFTEFHFPKFQITNA